MLINDTQVGTWRDVAFTLRGRPATYKTVDDTLNTKTGAIAVSNGLFPITVLVSGADSSTTVERTFRVRNKELPSGAPRIGDTITLCDVDYVIRSWKSDQSEYVYDILARRP